MKPKVTNTYSLQYLEERLKELLEDNNQVNYILHYLKEKRKKSINSEIKILDNNNE